MASACHGLRGTQTIGGVGERGWDKGRGGVNNRMRSSPLRRKSSGFVSQRKTQVAINSKVAENVSKRRAKI